MNDKLQIKTCPTCSSDKIKRVTRDLTRVYKGSEKVFDHEAMLKIESHSPAYRKAESVTPALRRRYKASKGAPQPPA
ncbi:hypothetical protein FBQ81_19385 [Chloroflexi bacterium CFX6]|nr:hypothetical protein [Chloroflexi bacterium CFX6]